MDRVPLNEAWRVGGKENADLITQDYILKTANEWNKCDPTVVPSFVTEDQIGQSDIRICFKGT